MSFNQNINHFLLQTDGVGQTLFMLLAAMSVSSWYFIIIKAWQGRVTLRRTRIFLNKFWEAACLEDVAQTLSRHRDDEPFSHLTYHAINANHHHAVHSMQCLQETGTAGDFLTRAMRRVIDEETAKLEWGLTLLASIASTAPFVGLFGNVWGVYHALIDMGGKGQGTLEQIAGPVGEALIMTGLGLAVAIPAVLAYNDCVRSNRVLLAQLDAFAHDLFAFLTTGSAINAQTNSVISAHKVNPAKAGAM